MYTQLFHKAIINQGLLKKNNTPKVANIISDKKFGSES